VDPHSRTGTTRCYDGGVVPLVTLSRLTAGLMKLIPFLLVCLALPGCSSEAEKTVNNPVSTTAAPPVLADDPSALQALSVVGAKTKRNADGLVIEVNLRGTGANDDTLKAIAPLLHLRALLLNDLNITDAGLETLRKADWPITHLDLRGCPISNAGLAHLVGLSSLRALRLSGSNSETTVDDDGMTSLAGLITLEVLSLDKLWISVAGIEQLLTLQNLEELYLADTTIGDDTLELLPRFPRLRILRLSRNQISNDGLKHLAKLYKLVELDLSEISLLSDRGMLYLSRLTSLTKLNLWRVPIGDAGVAHLKPLTSLEWLNLDNTKLSDTGLPSLVDMKQLSFLHLGSTLVSDVGLPHLSGLTALKDLKVTRTSVTDVGVKELKKSLPATEIQLVYQGY